MKEAKYERPHTVRFHVYGMSRLGRSTEREVSGCQGLGGRESGEGLMGKGLLLWDDKNVLKLDFFE